MATGTFLVIAATARTRIMGVASSKSFVPFSAPRRIFLSCTGQPGREQAEEGISWASCGSGGASSAASLPFHRK
jgi:hypothetical protein